MVVLLLSCFPLWRGKLLLIKSVMAGLCCSSNGTWQWAWHVSCQGQAFKHTTLKQWWKSLLCVCLCVCEWLILLPPMQWKKEVKKQHSWEEKCEHRWTGTRSCLQRFLERTDGEIFFWGSCNVINNLLFYQFPVYFYLLFCLQYIILSAGAATLHTPSCLAGVRVKSWACHWWMCRSCQNNTKM